MISNKFDDIFRRRAERIASGVKVDEKDLDAAAKQTAQDFEEAMSEELKLFVKAQRITRKNEAVHYFPNNLFINLLYV